MKRSHVLPTSINKRLISTLMSTRKVDPNEKKDFTLKSSSEFASRSGDVFGKLQCLENQHKTWVTENDTLECFEESDERTLPDPKPPEPAMDFKSPNKLKSVIVFRKPNSVPKADSDVALFKKPYPAKNFRKNVVPGFKKQPQKWTKYSLEDVPISSDATNAKAAFQFLNELKCRKEEKVDLDELDEDGDKIVFKKPKQKERNATARCKTRVPLIVEELEPDSSDDEIELSKSSGGVLLSHLEEED